jgi:hypothetical protein
MPQIYALPFAKKNYFLNPVWHNFWRKAGGENGAA